MREHDVLTCIECSNRQDIAHVLLTNSKTARDARNESRLDAHSSSVAYPGIKPRVAEEADRAIVLDGDQCSNNCRAEDENELGNKARTKQNGVHAVTSWVIGLQSLQSRVEQAPVVDDVALLDAAASRGSLERHRIYARQTLRQ
jgi:hypothetical protein